MAYRNGVAFGSKAAVRIDKSCICSIRDENSSKLFDIIFTMAILDRSPSTMMKKES